MLYAALVPLLPHYADEFGLSKGQAGLLVGAYALGAFFGAVPGGIAAARFGPRRAYLRAACDGGRERRLRLRRLAPRKLGVARLAQGVGSALSWAGALAWLVAGTPRERRGEMLGTAIGAAIFGALLGPAVGATAEAIGPRPAFIAVAGVALGLLVWALRTPAVAAEPQSPRALGPALRSPLILGALWMMVLPALLFGVIAVLVPLELGDAGWSAAAIAGIFIVSAAIEMVVAPLIGRFSDRNGRFLPLRLALVGSIVVSLGLALRAIPYALAPLVVAAAIAFGAFWAPAMALLSDGADRIGLAQGLGFGLMNAAWGGGNALGPVLGGALADAAGDAVPFALMAGVCAVTLLGVSRGRHLFGTPLARVPENP